MVDSKDTTLHGQGSKPQLDVTRLQVQKSQQDQPDTENWYQQEVHQCIQWVMLSVLKLYSYGCYHDDLNLE